MHHALSVSAAALLVLFPLCACDAGDGGQDSPVPNGSAGAPAGLLPALRLIPVLPGVEFRRPVQVTHAGDGSGRLFVLEQTGRIMVFDPGADEPAPAVFLDITEQTRYGHNEEGLLSLAFHPAYRENGRFFVYYSTPDPRRGRLSSFRVSSGDPNRAAPESEQVILDVGQPWGNHNGSTVLFGPDGYLYMSLGDGGAAGDPLNSGQDLSTLLGSIIRIDVDTPSGERPYSIPADNPFVEREGARAEIWAWGLRNVWRMSFDRETGELWAGDVGQNRWEEIDIIVKGGNYGWKLREGKHPFQPDAPSPASADDLIDPIHEYPRSDGISITGGHVYRGSEIPALTGAYVYADYGSGRIWALRAKDGAVTAHKQVVTGRHFVTSFGENEAGEILVVTFEQLDGRWSSGRVWRIGGDPKVENRK